MRHPGRALAPGERPPAPMVAYVARQLGVDAAALARWSNRAQTRREQIGDLMKAHGFMTFGREEAAAMVRWLTPVAQIERRPQRLIETLLAELRRRRILLPPPRVLELVVHRARAVAARVTWRALAGDLTAAQDGALDALLGASPDPRRVSPASPGSGSFPSRQAHAASMPSSSGSRSFALWGWIAGARQPSPWQPSRRSPWKGCS